MTEKEKREYCASGGSEIETDFDIIAEVTPYRKSGALGAKVIQVIETKATQGGLLGTDEPFRVVTRYWSTDGELLAEVDPYFIGLMEDANPAFKSKRIYDAI